MMLDIDSDFDVLASLCSGEDDDLTLQMIFFSTSILMMLLFQYFHTDDADVNVLVFTY